MYLKYQLDKSYNSNRFLLNSNIHIFECRIYGHKIIKKLYNYVIKTQCRIITLITIDAFLTFAFCLLNFLFVNLKAHWVYMEQKYCSDFTVTNISNLIY